MSARLWPSAYELNRACKDAVMMGAADTKIQVFTNPDAFAEELHLQAPGVDGFYFVPTALREVLPGLGLRPTASGYHACSDWVLIKVHKPTERERADPKTFYMPPGAPEGA